TRSYGDWSSDVCSSDLALQQPLRPAEKVRPRVHAKRRIQVENDRLDLQEVGRRRVRVAVLRFRTARQNGRLCGIGRVECGTECRSEERRVGKEWRSWGA